MQALDSKPTTYTNTQSSGDINNKNVGEDEAQ